MSRDAKINREDAQIEIVLHGMVGGAEFAWGLREIERACRKDSVVSVVWDFRKADLSQLNFEVIQGSVEDWPALALGEDARIAAVAGNQLDEILLRLWREAGQHRDRRQRMVFLDIEEARIWAAQK